MIKWSYSSFIFDTKRLLYVYAISSFSRFQWKSTTWFFSTSNISVFVLPAFYFHKTEKVFPKAKPISAIARVIFPWRWSWTLMAGCMILSQTLSFTQNDWTMRNWIWKIVWTFFGWMSNNFGIRVDCLNLWNILSIFIVIVYFIGQSQQDKSDIKILDFFYQSVSIAHRRFSYNHCEKKINEAKRMKFSQRFVLTQIMYELTNF